MIPRFSSFLVVCSLILLAGCSRVLQNNDPKAMAQWKQRYGENEQSSQVLNSMPRDDLGRIVELRAIPKRVLVIGPGATEIVYALGLQSKLVGRDSASDFPVEAAKLPVIGDYKGPNLEQSVAANPDFVIVQGETYGSARIEQWQKQIGVPVACLAATTVGGVAQDAQKIGAWLGLKKIPALFDTSKLKTINQKAEGPAAMIEISRQPFMVAGSGTLIDDVLRQAGLRNAAGDVEGYKQLNLEVTLAKAPDFYVVTSGTLKNEADLRTNLVAERNRVLDSLRQTPGLKNLQCVRRGRVIVVPANWVLRPGPRLREGIAEIARQHSELEK